MEDVIAISEMPYDRGYECVRDGVAEIFLEVEPLTANATQPRRSIERERTWRGGSLPSIVSS